MATLGDTPSSFFMFCFGDFERKLSIPIAFAKDHRDFLSQISMNLTTESEEVWEVKIKNIDGDFYITDGWSDFVRDNSLTHMKLLVFHINGESRLRVSIFGYDSCLELPKNPLKFFRTLKTYNKTDQRMDLPKWFVEESGIWKTMRLQLENREGRRWPIKVTDRNLKMYNMSSGWAGFLKDNNLKTGDRLSFEFIPGSENVLKVLQMENGSPYIRRAAFRNRKRRVPRY